MKILQIFNKYQHPGGEEASVLRVADTLGRRHEVIRCYFDSKKWVGEEGGRGKVWHALAMIWNPAAVARVMRHVREDKPDLILLHNPFPVCSAYLIWKLSWLDVPVVQYIHNFRPFSVNGYCWADGQISESGFRRNFIPEIRSASWQESRLRTAWYALVLWLLHLSGTYRRFAHWIAISEFMRDKFVAAGIDPGRITSLRHSWTSRADDEAQSVSALRAADELPLFLFLGRLSEEKGVRVLFEAWEAFVGNGGRARLMICGTGPLEDEVVAYANSHENVRFAGQIEGEEKDRLLSDARAVVVPSIWWEPLGIVVYEAYDRRKPVLAAASGGLTETVVDGKTGWLHEPGDAAMLAGHMERMVRNPEGAEEMGREARRHLLGGTNPEDWLGRLESVFQSVLEKRGRGKLRLMAYLADQNPRHDRSYGISRMSETVLAALAGRKDVGISILTSRSALKCAPEVGIHHVLPWSTRLKFLRVLTDHLHPWWLRWRGRSDVYYYPKGYLPAATVLARPSVVTIHDTIIEHYRDHYPGWRRGGEYFYWARMLRGTIKRANAILTVSESSKQQIEAFMRKYRLEEKPVIVTYEPCIYEDIPQPDNPPKGDYVIHFASREPHKRTKPLMEWWCDQAAGAWPRLHLVGTLPNEVADLPEVHPGLFVRHSYLEDETLAELLMGAKALILPSEIEGFGLPALEAYFLGTPVCYTRGISVEEVLRNTTRKGGFDGEDPRSLELAMNEVFAMSATEVRECGLALRETYAAAEVAERMMAVFEDVAERGRASRHWPSRAFS